MFPGGGCPVPEFLASGTASAVSKRVYGGADANRTIAMAQGKFSELRLSTHRSDIGGCCHTQSHLKSLRRALWSARSG